MFLVIVPLAAVARRGTGGVGDERGSTFESELFEQEGILAFSLFGVVKSLSPVKTLLPAKKQSACVSGLMLMRPALSRTTVAGIKMRATAMARTISNPLGGVMPSNGVPPTGTNA